jgi:hypothetical protein
MSLIRYQRATYAVQLRDQLEMAGCNARVSALVSRAVGELIDHVLQAEVEMRRDIKERELRASVRTSEAHAFKRDFFDRVVGVAVLVMTVVIVVGVLIELFR